MSARFESALGAIDALHAQDPQHDEREGVRTPAELAYARRMSAALARLVESPSEALGLAVRAQHLCRWRLPRRDYPEGRAGYLRWRTEQARQHAALASEALRSAGYDDAFVARVGALVRKRDLARDPEAQALEDAACLVFLEHELDAFARDRDEGHVVAILRKSWAKMSPRGRAAALELRLTERGRALVARALDSASQAASGPDAEDASDA
jgi:hypothetical protein